MKTVVVCLGLAAALCAQDPSKTDPHPLIQGVILEAGTNRGLPGAQILINQEGSQAVRTTTTDSQGAFHFEPDQFGHFD
jgi:carboxypeptidase family protein